jgi:hypothetical protein
MKIATHRIGNPSAQVKFENDHSAVNQTPAAAAADHLIYQRAFGLCNTATIQILARYHCVSVG